MGRCGARSGPAPGPGAPLAPIMVKFLHLRQQDKSAHMMALTILRFSCGGYLGSWCNDKMWIFRAFFHSSEMMFDKGKVKCDVFCSLPFYFQPNKFFLFYFFGLLFWLQVLRILEKG